MSRGVLLPLLLLVIACSSPRSTEQQKNRILQQVVAGQGKDAAKGLDKLYDCSLRSEGNDGTLRTKHSLLWRLERGSVAHLAGDPAAAEAHWVAAHQAARTFRSRSSLEAAATWLANETVRTYYGLPHEHVGIEVGRMLAAVQQAQILDGSLRPSGVPSAAGDAVAAREAYQRGVIAARGLVNDVLKWIAQVDGNERYRDDGCGRLLAGAATMALPAEQQESDDRQFAVAALGGALKAYEQNQRQLSGGSWRYEVPGMPRTARALHLRALAAYDPEGLAGELRRLGLGREAATEQGLLPPAGHGSVLVVHEWGFCARRFILDFRLVSGYVDQPYEDGYRRDWGGFVAWVSGPDKSLLDRLILLPLPGEVAQILAPGGLSFIGFAVPVHAPDRPVPTPARIGHRSGPGTPGGAAIGAQLQLEVAGDYDAIARASLKEHQAGLVMKTLIRTCAKQVPVALAAREAKRKADAKDGTDLLALAINLFGSSIATITEIADTRCWTLLPGHVEVGLLDLPAGEHDLTLLTADGRQAALGTVTVTPGRLLMVPVRSLTEPPLAP